MRSNKLIKILILLSLFFSIEILVHADNKNISNKTWQSCYQNADLEVWSSELCTTDSAQSSVLKTVQAFKLIQKSIIFKDRLNMRVGVLLDSSWKKTSGYWSADLKTPKEDPAILLSPQATLQAVSLQKLLTHELTHLVHQQYRPQEQPWIREGLAMLAEYLVTHFHNASIIEAFDEPETSLTEVSSPDALDYDGIQNQAAQYGHIAQFFYYTYRLCGKIDFFNDLLESKLKSTGTEFFSEVLQKNQCLEFDTTFRQFEIARFLNSPTSKDTYVLPTYKQTKVREAPLIDLPLYSASAYEKPNSLKHCQKNEYSWGDSRCIRFRYQK